MSQSYSSIKLYEQCAAKYKFSRIDRLPEPTGPAAERGKMIHAELESILKGGLEILCEEAEHLLPKIDVWKEQDAKSEMEFAVNNRWDPVDFNDPTYMLRGIIDLYIEDGDRAIVLDFKTGKERDYTDQVAVYATVILATKPHINEVVPAIEFIDTKKSLTYNVIHRKDLQYLKQSVEGRVNIIERDKIYAPNPSGLCRFCHYRKDNGGPCKW